MSFVANDKMRLEMRAKQGRRSTVTSYNRKAKKGGYVHRGLILHLSKPTMFERVLAYEAMMNGVTLGEWVERNRPGGAQTGDELYAAPGLFIYHLDGDRFNCKPENLHCFESKSDYLSWKRRNQTQVVRLQSNIDQIKTICAAWTSRRWKHLEEERKTDLWGVYRMTHVAQMVVGFNSAFRNDLMYTLLCSLTGQQMTCANVPHVEVELENGQKIWLTEERVRVRKAGDH